MDNNILLCKWNSCCEELIERSLKAIGYTVDSVKYDFVRADYSTECVQLLTGALDKKNYSYVISHNFIPIVAKVCRIYKIIYISWVMDSPAYHLYSDAIYSPYNRIFIFDKSLYDRMYMENPDCIFYYHLGSDTDWWDSVTIDDSKYNCDVSFMGSMYTEMCKYNAVKDVPDYIQGYMEGLMEAQLSVYGYNFLEESLDDDIAREYAKYADWDTSDDYRQNIKEVIADVYLGQKCSEIERHRIVNELYNLCDFRLYTNSDISHMPHIKNMGTIYYYDEMPLLYRQSKINLNITSKSIRTGVPLRVFDVLGCGGFLITNYQAEIPEYFEIGKDLVVYESIEDLKQKVLYYLEHDDIREEIARNGHQKVKQNYSFEICIREMLDIASR